MPTTITATENYRIYVANLRAIEELFGRQCVELVQEAMNGDLTDAMIVRDLQDVGNARTNAILAEVERFMSQPQSDD